MHEPPFFINIFFRMAETFNMLFHVKSFYFLQIPIARNLFKCNDPESSHFHENQETLKEHFRLKVIFKCEM